MSPLPRSRLVKLQFVLHEHIERDIEEARYLEQVLGVGMPLPHLHPVDQHVIFPAERISQRTLTYPMPFPQNS